MQKRSWLRVNWKRSLVIGLCTLFILALLLTDARTFPQTSFFLAMAGVNSLLFLLVGSLVLLYHSKSKLTSVLLFLFCVVAAAVFAAEGGASVNDPLFSVVADAGSALGVATLAWLLTIFPYDGFQMRWVLGGRAYIAWIIILGVLAFAFSSVSYFASKGEAFFSLSRGCFLLLFAGIIWHLIACYKAISATAKQQQRFFLFGVLMSICPLLFLTILPATFNLPAIAGQWSALAFIFLPITLGYGVLRYQLLIADHLIARCITASLCLLFFLIGFIPLDFVMHHLPPTWQEVVSVGMFLALILICWQAGRFITERWVLVELRYFRNTMHRFIDNPAAIDGRDLHTVSMALLSALSYYFSSVQCCLLVLDESDGVFRAYTPDAEMNDKASQVVRFVCQTLGIAAPTEHEMPYALPKSSLEYLVAVPRPVLLSEAKTIKGGRLTGRRYLISLSAHPEDLVLLAPLRMQKEMIGLVILGERQSQPGYAGPDLEKLQMLLDEFAPMIETSRLYARAAQHALLLEQLYKANTSPVDTAQNLETVACSYARVAANACACRAEIWRYEDEDAGLCYLCGSGNGPRIVSQNQLALSSDQHWLPYFYAADLAQAASHTLPSCIDLSVTQSLAWLPLQVSSQRIGMLVLTYAFVHAFSQEERRVLNMFAAQCAIALDNARVNLALHEAYERQKELDRLKDQFIATASHELRTPLTAVQGYIELLSEYGAGLTPEMRSSFIANARRGCDELALMVGNIMDASRVPIEAEHVQLMTLRLRASVVHVLEILEVMTRREERTMVVNIDPSLMVRANDMRLHQVLLNLLSNALKYSLPATTVKISASSDEQQVTVRIRDYGFGVPVEEQEHLFERFVRLERDMNSPVRGAGLGLYISRRLVETMGGSIWMESSGQANEGSTFAFTLQRAQHAPAVPSRHENQTSGLSLP
jgi:signal transduction histidine kinase